MSRSASAPNTRQGSAPPLDLAPARRRGSRPSQRIGRPPRRRYRLGLRPLPLLLQSRVLIQGRTAKQVERAWEVVDDFPGEITVLPRELRVIWSREGWRQVSLQARQPNGMWNRNKIDNQLLAGAKVIANTNPGKRPKMQAKGPSS
jgi:hypothetical protein